MFCIRFEDEAVDEESDFGGEASIRLQLGSCCYGPLAMRERSVKTNMPATETRSIPENPEEEKRSDTWCALPASGFHQTDRVGWISYDEQLKTSRNI